MYLKQNSIPEQLSRCNELVHYEKKKIKLIKNRTILYSA